MDFLKEALKSQTGHKPNHTTTTTPDHAEHKPEHHQSTQTRPHKQPSTSELMTSAKVVAGAAKATIGHTKEEIDKVKVAGAAGDLLSGVKHYGKLEENVGLGKYVGKAETYLHKYESSHSSSVGGPTVAGAGSAGVGKEKKKDGHGSHGGGVSDYFKMAEGFLKK